ncbi:retrotransposon protein, putative, ty1-copia subclass [Tanacetum coccineum]
MDGKVHIYKARLIVKGYTQTHEIYYEETFSPVPKIKSIRIMLDIAAFHDYEIWLMDVKTAFLNGKLTKDVFMAQPEGFENEKYPKRFRFSRSEDQSCIYVKVSGSVVVFLVLYVDDILLIGNDIPTLQSVKDWLGKCFAMKDLGDATYVLGIKIYRDMSKRLIGLSQDTYLDKILKRFKMENSKKWNLPLHHGIKISKDLCPKSNAELDKMSRVPYASAIGSIMYVMTCRRPDVPFALSMVSRRQQNPGEGHWTVVKNILKYLRNTKDMFLVYGGEEELKVTGYFDASWQTYRDDSCNIPYFQSSAVTLDDTLWNMDSMLMQIRSTLEFLTQTVARNVCPTEDAYSSSKADVVTLTKVMAMEMATHNIRMNTIYCGIFKSEITEGLMQKKWFTRMAQRTRIQT